MVKMREKQIGFTVSVALCRTNFNPARAKGVPDFIFKHRRTNFTPARAKGVPDFTLRHRRTNFNPARVKGVSDFFEAPQD
jgi:hypothetical protein